MDASASTRQRPRKKNKGGRPHTFKPDYCKRVIEFMSRGYSLTAFAGIIKKSRETVYEWGVTVPEFSYALTIARARRTLYWERRLQHATRDSRPVIFALRNCCSDEWKEEPTTSVVLNNSITVDTNRPVEQWGKAELRAELARRNALPKIPVLNGERKK
jgi:hypothetical protein